jgi:hypothetical protein
MKERRIFKARRFVDEPIPPVQLAKTRQRVCDHVAQGQRAIEHQIDQRRPLGDPTLPLQLVLEPMSSREPPIVSLTLSEP